MSEYNIARDVLEFRLTGYRYGPESFPMAAVEIYINGEKLREKVCKQELPFAEQEGNPGIAGHAPITPRELYQSLHDDYAEEECVSILGCCCGVVDCWPLDVAIEVGKNVVTWYGFNMYHRKNWDYSSLGSFVFDKQQYWSEVDKLLEFEEQGRILFENFAVSFDAEKNGCAKMNLYLSDGLCHLRLSYLYSPFDDILRMIKNIENDSTAEEIYINEEGVGTTVSVQSTSNYLELDVSVDVHNAVDRLDKHYKCRTTSKIFIYAFRLAFMELEDEGFDPNYWVQHDKGYEYDEDETNPREINTSFWKDPWFDYLKNDIVDYNPFHTLASGLRVQPKLAPCPYCGSSAEFLVYDTGPDGFCYPTCKAIVACTHCGAQTECEFVAEYIFEITNYHIKPVNVVKNELSIDWNQKKIKLEPKKFRDSVPWHWLIVNDDVEEYD